MPSLGDRLQHAWNAFRNNRDPTYHADFSDRTEYDFRAVTSDL